MSHFKLPLRFSLLFMAMLLFADCEVLIAQRTIEVTGRSENSVMPDAVEIRAKVEAMGPTAKKALESFRAKKGEFNTAVNPMSFSGVETTFSGPSVGPSASTAQNIAVAMMGGDGAVEVDDDSLFSVSEEVFVSLKGLADMEEDEVASFVAKLTDAMIKNGGVVGEAQANPFGIETTPKKQVRYYIGDQNSVVADGEAKAMAAARASAERLAKLAGGRIGKVISIKQVAATTESDASDAESLMMKMYGLSEGAPEDFSSRTYGAIKVNSSLQVTFELID